MQEILWKSSPYLIFGYPFQLAAYHSDKWQGVTPSPTEYEGYDGSAFYGYVNVDSYRFVEPVTGVATTTNAGADTTVLLIGSLAAARFARGLGLPRPRAVESCRERLAIRPDLPRRASRS